MRKRLFVAFTLIVVCLFIFTSCESTSTTIPSTTETTNTTTPITTTYQETSTTTPNHTPSIEVEAKVTKIIDGDTIEVDIGGETFRVRYIGIDTPELDDTRIEYSDLAEEAMLFNKQLVERKTIKLEKDISEVDKYGRLLRYVYVNGIFVNAELVAQGLAWAKAYEPDIRYQDYLEELELKAQQDGKGIWGVGLTTTVIVSPVEIEDVRITYIFYDGLVPRVESDEYVEIKNFGDKPQNLLGWVLKDISEGYPSFTFPDYILGPGQSIRVYTNEIHTEYGGFSFGYNRAIWNNSEPDTAVLYDNNGNEVSRKSY